jgi:surfactin synthase thioesterase subunit
MTRVSADPWFLLAPGRDPAVRLRVFCFPHGGAGPSAFRAWPSLVAPEVELVPVQLPGRERRLHEPSVRSITELRDRLAGPVAEYAGDVPYALLGHSMGALIAYELAHELRAAMNPPLVLAVSGAAAAHLPRRVPDVHHLPDHELRRQLVDLNGISAPVLANEDLLDLLLPVFRADFAACETYVHACRPPLDLRLLAFGGTGDPLVTPPEVERWAELNVNSTDVRILDGDHFFLFRHAGLVLSAIKEIRDSAQS